MNPGTLEEAISLLSIQRDKIERLMAARDETLAELERRAAECRAIFTEDFTDQVRLTTKASAYYHAIDVLRSEFGMKKYNE